MSEAIERVIQTIIENRRKFEAFCYSLTEKQLNRRVPESTWLVRDFAAHLGTLDAALLNWFGAVAAGGKADSGVAADGSPFDVDQYNDAQVAERRSWTLEKIFAEADANRAMLIERLRDLTDEQIDQPMHFAADAKRPSADLPLKLFLAGWAQHDPIHVADMIRAIPERATDVAAWIDNPFVASYQVAMNKPHGAEQP